MTVGPYVIQSNFAFHIGVYLHLHKVHILSGLIKETRLVHGEQCPEQTKFQDFSSNSDADNILLTDHEMAAMKMFRLHYIQ